MPEIFHSLMPILERRAENEVRTLSPDYDDRIALGYLGYVVFLGSNLVLDCFDNARGEICFASKANYPRNRFDTVTRKMATL